MNEVKEKIFNFVQIHGMDFESYLKSKKIDSEAFKQAKPDLWNEWEKLFNQLSPISFTSQKLYLINSIRRNFLLK